MMRKTAHHDEVLFKTTNYEIIISLIIQKSDKIMEGYCKMYLLTKFSKVSR